MRRDIPIVRILPMSDKREGFVGLSIEQVQKKCFLRDLPAGRGRFHYLSSGLNAPADTLVLFQFKARIIASAVFLRDERFEQPIRGCAGALHFDVASIQTFDPLDIGAIRAAWPGMRGFGHVKQVLNAAMYPVFKRRLKHIARPVPARPSRIAKDKT